MSDGRIAIAVPVRNEAKRLPRLLRALSAQEGAQSVTLALFFDNCDDGSEALTASFELPFPVIFDRSACGSAANAGRARRHAMRLALEAAPNGTLLTTDADSMPAPDWVAASRRGLAAADIVAGRIMRMPGRNSPPHERLEQYYDRLHQLRRLLDPVAWEAPHTHHWTSGASLALPATVYRAVGGFQDHVSGEDAAFVDTAARCGWRVRRDGDVRVATSSRRRGRAPGGFAAALSAWDKEQIALTVTHPEDEAWRYVRQAQARAAYGGPAIDVLAQDLHLPLDEVRQVEAECRNAEAFTARIVGSPPGGMRHISLSRAELLIGALEAAPLRVVA